jgi:hypothetical protein
MTTENVELTISLCADLAHTIKAYAAKEGKTPEEFVVSALWELRKGRGMRDLKRIQSYWSQRAEELGVHTEEDLIRYLES